MSDKISMIRQAWVEVNLRNLRYNFKLIRKRLPKNIKIMAIIKQSAYGHGLIPIAKELSKLGIDFFGIGSVEDGILLRENKIRKPIVVLSAVLPKFAKYFLDYRIIPTVVDLNFAKKLNYFAKERREKISIHIKIDTGMGRLGPFYKNAINFINELLKFENLILEGIFTHFPAADTDRKFTYFQMKVFKNLLKKLKKQNIVFKYIHCANSIALLRYSQFHFNLVRPGLILYGIKPTPFLKEKLKPVLSLKSRLIFIKEVEKNTSISYGRTYFTPKKTKIGVVSFGYADGYPWQIGDLQSEKRPKVIIRNKFYPIVGRICMDHFMVDLGNDPIKVGEEVIILGKSKNLEISAEDLASWAGTIPYEIVSRISFRLPYFYKK